MSYTFGELKSDLKAFWGVFIKSVKTWQAIFLLIAGTLNYLIVTKTPDLEISWWAIAFGNLIALLSLYIIYLLIENKHVRADIHDLAVDLDRARAEVRVKPGIVIAGDRSLMVFDYDPSCGVLSYGDHRNIVLRVSTLQHLLEVVRDAAGGGREGSQVLRKAGVAVGRDFATDFLAKVRGQYKAGASLTPEQRLDRWTEYDRNAGFGRLENRSQYVRDAGQFEGDIHLQYSFLTEGRSAEDKPLCSFMAGYIEGFLNRFENRATNDIVICETRCDREDIHDIDEGCRFSISYEGADLQGQDDARTSSNA